MHILIGLGNPGLKYAHTRHNAGFDVLDILAKRNGIRINKLGHKGLYGEGYIGSERVILLKPQTYMNESGTSVVSAVRYFRADPAQVLVLYDDLDLPVGRIRIRGQGSAGTHNGMRDILYKWQTDAFPRIRIGIGKPPEGWEIVNYVLAKPKGAEQTQLAQAMEQAAEAAETVVTEGLIRAQDIFNRKKLVEKAEE